MTDRYEKIRRTLAMGPTPGSREVFDLGMWDVEVRSSDTSGTICQVNNKGALFRASEDGADRVGRSQGRLLSDAFFIAACDSDTIRALLEERDALAKDAARWRYVRRYMSLDDVGDQEFCLGLVINSEALEHAVTMQSARLYAERAVAAWEDVRGPEDSPKDLPRVTLEDAIDAAMEGRNE